MVNIDEYDQLKSLCWFIKVNQIKKEEAFCLYENNSRWLCFETMSEKEKLFIKQLCEEFGSGYFLGHGKIFGISGH